MDLKEKTQNENRHPWELSRTKNLINIVMKYLLDKGTVKIADIGAGDMYFDTQLSKKLKDENITSVIFAIDKEYREEALGEREVIMLNDIQILEKNSMDCIVMMDVLEHIEDVSNFLELVLDKLKDNGVLITTVPAFQSLFSHHDTFLCHLRRYEYEELRNLLLCKKLDVIYSHYFYTTLYFARWLQVKLEKVRPRKIEVGIGMWKYDRGNFITKSIELVLNVDFRINKIISKIGIRLPGLSLLAVAKKGCNSNLSQ